MAATVKKLDELLATGDLPVLGWTLSWHLSGVEIQHVDLVNLLKLNQLEAWIPGEPTQRQALRRAVEEWIRQRANRQGGPRLSNEAALRDDGSGNAQRALVRCINRAGSQFLIYELVVENVDLRALRLSYAGDLQFVLEKASGLVTVKYASSQHDNDQAALAELTRVEREIKPLWAKYKTLQTAGDITYSIRRNVLFGMNAISLRDGGGYYFVPAARREQVEALKRVFAALDGRGGAAFLLALPQLDIAGARRSLAQAAHVAFEAEIATLETDLDRLRTAEAGTVRPATLAKQVQAFKDFRVKAEAYGDLLGMRQERVADAVERLTALARTVVLAGTAAVADEPAATAPAEPDPDTAAAK